MILIHYFVKYNSIRSTQIKHSCHRDYITAPMTVDIDVFKPQFKLATIKTKQKL